MTDQPDDAPPSAVQVCTCDRTGGTQGAGFSNRGTADQPWWVHAKCGLPTHGWLSSPAAEVAW